MDTQNLIHMANRIADFFAAMPAHEDAVDGVATHLRKFWEPRMRLALKQAVAAGEAEGLHPLVREAVGRGI
ncbi:formate dehydrogenase subunit delta [Inhella sp.]|uniref:formate dehydrogenase subunit delta n=1 Tax=Inhella sp. TaxID=1921806 RepID=UPI0035AECAD1